MPLPLELIDEIIRYLVYDIPSLCSCSLVAKTWMHLCRKWLFKDVTITRGIQQRWLDRISPTNVELLCNVRSFTYTHDPNVWNGVKLHRIDSLYHYFSAFSHLEALKLCSIFLGPDVPQQIGLHSVFLPTLTSLTIRRSHVTSSALITLINYFPSLINLDLRSIGHAADLSPVPPLSRPLRGRLFIGDCNSRDRALFKELSTSVKHLQLLSGAVFRRGASPTLSHCQGLRQLEVSELSPAYDKLSLIASITSTNLRKISLPARYQLDCKDDSHRIGYYETIDGCLCQLVERLRGSGYKHRLDVELWIWGSKWNDEKVDFKKLLPKFREQGRVEIVERLSGRVVYCSN
ncbi:hypothetical protein BDM02DRAFT_3115866 [Thelephora ganbajun]|uniref:Uncharacterized protein n=1 Tax=Thelephora ganbajun TaxID=370292 RepID=A0ACB6ZEX2_THEGA|nr:hypothetical protein BDM02DRAFT_3115866 [Thelephora ganbajun]